MNKYSKLKDQLGSWIKIPPNNAPKNVLPTSPMKILAGLQLKIKKAVNDPTKGMSDGENIIEKIVRYIIIDPATKPSIPSIKFTKFIIAIKDIINNIFKK